MPKGAANKQLRKQVKGDLCFVSPKNINRVIKRSIVPTIKYNLRISTEHPRIVTMPFDTFFLGISLSFTTPVHHDHPIWCWILSLCNHRHHPASASVRICVCICVYVNDSANGRVNVYNCYASVYHLNTDTDKSTWNVSMHTEVRLLHTSRLLHTTA